MTLLAGDWFQSWEAMAGAAVFILYVLGSIIGGKKKPEQRPRGTPPQAPQVPRRMPQAPRPPRQPPSGPAPGQAGPPRPPRVPPPQAPRPTPMVTHTPPATSTLRPAELRRPVEQRTHHDMPPPIARPPAPPPIRAPAPPGARRPAPPRPAAPPPRRPVIVEEEPPRRRPATLAEGESALAVHRPREQGVPSEIIDERRLHETPAEIEAERRAHRLVREGEATGRRGDDLRDKLLRVLRSRSGVRGAILLSEIISPPVALREGHLR